MHPIHEKIEVNEAIRFAPDCKGLSVVVIQP